MSDVILDEGAISEVAALSAARKAIDHASLKIEGCDVPLAAILKDGSYQTIDLKSEADKWRTAPRSRTGQAKVLTIQSFCDLVNRHKDDHSVIFADIMSDAPSLLSVIDYHQIDHAPRFGKHRVSYAFPLSVEWKAWKAKNGVSFDQGAFAEWLEDHIAELASATSDEREQFEPLVQTDFGSPSEIMRLSRGLSINVESKVADIRTLQSGAGQIAFEEVHKDSDGKPLKIPGLFMLSIPLFFGGVNVRIPARLRYRKIGASINWSFHLYRAEDFIHAALFDALKLVATETGLPVFEGSPEV